MKIMMIEFKRYVLHQMNQILRAFTHKRESRGKRNEDDK